MASLKQLEKDITREAKASEADLLRAHKQLETAIKDEAKGLKAEEKARAQVEKAAAKESKTAHKVVHAQHKEENAKADIQRAEESVKRSLEHQEGLKGQVESHKHLIADVKANFDDQSRQRQATLQPLRTPAPDPAHQTAASPTSPTKTHVGAVPDVGGGMTVEEKEAKQAAGGTI